MRVIFAGTPEFACPVLAALTQYHQVVAVFTQPDRQVGRGKKVQFSAVKRLAVEHQLDVYQPNSLKGQQSIIAALHADVMVVVAYGLLLPQAILDTPRLGCLNVHASLLPRWRGAAPIQRAIEAGDTTTGIAIMQMEAGLDTGPVFTTRNTDIRHDETSQTLHLRLSEMGAQAIIDTLHRIDKDSDFRAIAQAQDGVTYAKKITKAEADINWSQSAATIDRKIRAFLPWPVCQTHHDNTRLRVWQAKVGPQQVDAQPGTVVAVDNGINVACHESVLRIQRLQRDGSKPHSARDFLNGYSLSVGDSFGN